MKSLVKTNITVGVYQTWPSTDPFSPSSYPYVILNRGPPIDKQFIYIRKKGPVRCEWSILFIFNIHLIPIDYFTESEKIFFRNTRLKKWKIKRRP